MFLNSSSVEGVYETLTPLWLRTILQIGCISRVSNQKAAGNQGSNHFNLEDIEFVNSVDFPYLSPKTAQYRKIYLYAITERSNASQLGIVGLFILDENEPMLISGKSYVWLVNTGLTNQALFHQDKPPINRLFKKYSQMNDNFNQKRADMKFTTSYTNSMQDAWQMCTEKLDTYVREKHGPTVVFVQGSIGDMSPRSWRRVCPSLYDMPVVMLPHNTNDEYFPLTWQMFASERMLQRLFILPAWLDDRLSSASYSHVPLSNLGRDVTMTMIDVLYARQLNVSVITFLKLEFYFIIILCK